jgi:large subunit ribosomal protein L9
VKRSTGKQSKIEVILRRDVAGTGRIGDAVRVRRGFARNHLIPGGHALPLSDANRKRIETEKAAYLAREAEKKTGLEALAARVANASVTIEAAANAEGHLFGSVGPREIAQALSAILGESIEPAHVALEEPIRQIGTHTVTVRLHAEVASELKVWVVGGAPSGGKA